MTKSNLHFTQRQINHHRKRHTHLEQPPVLELLHIGKQQDSEYGVFLCKEPWLSDEIKFSYPSMAEPFGLSYWERKTSQIGWTSDVRAFARNKIKQFEQRIFKEK